MPNVAAALREEIQRLARKEVKAGVGPLKKQRAKDRSAIAALKRKVASLERDVAFLQRREKGRLAKTPQAASAEGVRFSPMWVAADRARLDLSARDYADLVGVSMLTIYNWGRASRSRGHRNWPRGRRSEASGSARRGSGWSCWRDRRHSHSHVGGFAIRLHAS